MRDGTAPTRVYSGARPYEGAAFADRRANRTPQEEEDFREVLRRDPGFRETYNACASLLMRREELEACMGPASEEPLRAGDAVVLLGEEVHGAPGTANKSHRVVFFISGVLPGCARASPRRTARAVSARSLSLQPAPPRRLLRTLLT